MNKFTWTFNPDELWSKGTYDTVEECLNEARRDTYYKGQVIYVGEVIPYTFTVDADDVLERLGEQAFYEVGEAAYEWPSYKRDESLAKLSDDLTACVTNWLKKRNDLPSFYNIGNIRAIGVDSNEKIQ
jgi:hypothetical protein